ncbi:MAG: hypothetical protein C0490_10885 [Marivirga sp.]|nr:hypothetical protein [Marivirga sp.]
MENDHRNIYEQIGNLFYSIATGQHIRPLEVGHLKSLIRKNWFRGLTDSFISDETHRIIMTMDYLEGKKVTANEAFKEFSKYYTLNTEVFSKNVKQRIIDTATEITKIFKTDNPFNNVNLFALKDLLNLGRMETQSDPKSELI